MRDPLIGNWFLAKREQDDGSRACSWGGQLVREPGGGVVRCFLGSGPQTFVSLGDMRGWRFYDSKERRRSAGPDANGLDDEAHGGPGGRAGAGS